MAYRLKLVFAACAATLWAAPALADDPVACAPCDPPKPLTMREQIKADRAKYDRENLKTIARPWDGMNLGRPAPTAPPNK